MYRYIRPFAVTYVLLILILAFYSFLDFLPPKKLSLYATINILNSDTIFFPKFATFNLLSARQQIKWIQNSDTGGEVRIATSTQELFPNYSTPATENHCHRELLRGLGRSKKQETLRWLRVNEGQPRGSYFNKIAALYIKV